MLGYSEDVRGDGFAALSEKLAELADELYGHIDSIEELEEARVELEIDLAEVRGEIGECYVPEIERPLEALDYREAELRYEGP